MADTVLIDGSYGEGGGQILRTSVSLAALTGARVEIRNVRARRRPKPGLQPQHLAAVRAAAALCDAELIGAQVGSATLVFTPRGPVRAGSYRFDIGTAGATGLVAQTVIPALAHADAPSRATITGGTHVPHAPPADYVAGVYAPLLARAAGMRVAVALRAPGFYPRGGGEVALAIEPAAPRAFDLAERGATRAVRAWVLTAGLASHVADRGCEALARELAEAGLPAVAVERREVQAVSVGAAVGVEVECDAGAAGFVAIGERGRPVEHVAREAAEAYAAWERSGAACDEHLADQLVLPAVLARGESRWTAARVTEHLRTVLWLVQKFLPVEVALTERDDGTGAITLRSDGLATV